MSLIRLNIRMVFVPKGCCLTPVKRCKVKLPLKRKETYLRSTVSTALSPADWHRKGYMNAPARENTWEQRQAPFFTFPTSFLTFICNHLHTAFLLLNANCSWTLTPWLWQHLLAHLPYTEEFVTIANINSVYSVADKWAVKICSWQLFVKEGLNLGGIFLFISSILLNLV